jgi:AcrR family transcriptional regulator
LTSTAKRRPAVKAAPVKTAAIKTAASSVAGSKRARPATAPSKPAPKVSAELPSSPVVNAGRARNRSQSQRREELLRIAGDVFAQTGFASATVRHVADACNILSGSLYHHFTSKEAMVLEILDTYARELVTDYGEIAASAGSPDERLRAMISRAMSVVVNRRSQVTILHNDQPYLSQIQGYEAIRVQLNEVRSFWLKVINDGIKDGSFRPDVLPVMIYRTVMGTVLSAVRWFDPAGKLAASDIADSVADILLQGISQSRE